MGCSQKLFEMHGFINSSKITVLQPHQFNVGGFPVPLTAFLESVTLELYRTK